MIETVISLSSSELFELVNTNKNYILKRFLPENFSGWILIYVKSSMPFVYIHEGKLTYENKNSRFINGKIAGKFWFNGKTYFTVENRLKAYQVEKINLFSKLLDIRDFNNVDTQKFMTGPQIGEYAHIIKNT